MCTLRAKARGAAARCRCLGPCSQAGAAVSARRTSNDNWRSITARSDIVTLYTFFVSGGRQPARGAHVINNESTVSLQHATAAAASGRRRALTYV